MKSQRVIRNISICIVITCLSFMGCGKGESTEADEENITVIESTEVIETDDEECWSIADEREHLTREELDEVLRLLEEGCD